jgi:hypothetical protein
MFVGFELGTWSVGLLDCWIHVIARTMLVICYAPGPGAWNYGSSD